MAGYTIPTGQVAAHDKTLAAGVADTVTFTGVDLPMVEVMTDGTAAIYVAFGAGNTPTVGGANCVKVPAIPGSSVFPVHTAGATVVNLISSGTPVYSVAKAD